MSAPEPVAFNAIDPKSLQTTAAPLGKTVAPAAPPYTMLSFTQSGLSKYMKNANKNVTKNNTKKGGRRRRSASRRGRRI